MRFKVSNSVKSIFIIRIEHPFLVLIRLRGWQVGLIYVLPFGFVIGLFRLVENCIFGVIEAFFRIQVCSWLDWLH